MDRKLSKELKEDIILTQIENFFIDNLYMPTMQQLAEIIGDSHISCVHRAMLRLQDKGILIRVGKHYKLHDDWMLPIMEEAIEARRF